MVGRSTRHETVFCELFEWWEDLSKATIRSRAVLLPVPSRWGRTALLERFAAIVENDDAATIVINIPGGSMPSGVGLQAQALKGLLLDTDIGPTAAEVLGADRLSGAVQLGLGVGGLFVPFPAAAAMLVASVGLGGASRIWDDSPGGQEGGLARTARAVAAMSVRIPVLVLLDDTERLNPELAVTLVENLIQRPNGRVLVIAAVHPDSDFVTAVTSRARYGLTEERVRHVDVEFDMGYFARTDLVGELSPSLPAVAVRRIARRTRTFVDVFAVSSAERLTELDYNDETTALASVDKVIDALVERASPSPEAVILAWSGGVLHASQAEQALVALNAQRSDTDHHVVRFGSLVRLADPASPDLAAPVSVLTINERQRLAAALLNSALDLSEATGVGLVDRVVAWQAAHRVRADLNDSQTLTNLQWQLVRGLEGLDDSAAAFEVAAAALTEFPALRSGSGASKDRDELAVAVLRLARTRALSHDDPLIKETVAEALAGGAAVSLEARVWAAINLLSQPNQRRAALTLVEQVTGELETHEDLGSLGDQWRLLLAFHVGRAGHPAVAQRLLRPLLDQGSPEQWDLAQAVSYAVGGPQADTRLQIAVLEAELQALPENESEIRLRLHASLGNSYEALGMFQQALDHGLHELALRRLLEGVDHPRTLVTRSQIAGRTGRCGKGAEALNLYQELLPDQLRVMGPDHPETLATRYNTAFWTADSGEEAKALHLSKKLLPDLLRLLGRDHHLTMATRAILASTTGECGNAAEALRLYKKLLPDLERVLGPGHPSTLTCRCNVAEWTRRCGRAAESLRLSKKVLPDLERVLGPDHPDTLAARINIAGSTGECGDAAEALRLYKNLLADMMPVLGPNHPRVLVIRNDITIFTGQCGKTAESLRLSKELLPDLKRILGPDHPGTLATRINIAALTGQCGKTAAALRLFKELLPDLQRVLGYHHPMTTNARNHIAALSREV